MIIVAPATPGIFAHPSEWRYFTTSIHEAETVPFDRKRKNELFLVVDRLKVNPTIKHRLFEAVENAADIGNGKLLIVHEEEDILLTSPLQSKAPANPIRKSPRTPLPSIQRRHVPGLLWVGLSIWGQPDPETRDHGAIRDRAIAHPMDGQIQPAALQTTEIFWMRKASMLTLPCVSFPEESCNCLMNGSPEDKWYAIAFRL